MNQVITITGVSNRDFLEKYAVPGRVGLAGGGTLINKAIGRAQRHVDADKTWSNWAHAFLFQGKRQDKQHWDPPRPRERPKLLNPLRKLKRRKKKTAV